MQTHHVDGLDFDFQDNWTVSKYDEWGFYRNQFQKVRGSEGVKALDLLAIDPENTAWLVEVKDYRNHPRTKPSDLATEVAIKVFDTLAAMVPAKLYASDADERGVAIKIVRAVKLRVILHLEQPSKHSALRPIAINPADIKQKLRQLLKPIDAHPAVVTMLTAGQLGWTVR